MQVGQREEGDDLNSEINVTPFVDVMLVLLVIFMITAPMMNTGVDIALPQVEAENVEEAKGKIILSIGLDRRLNLSLAEGGRAPVQWSELDDKIKFNDKLQRESELYVEADKDLPYGVVVTAMAIARNAGVEKVMLLTDPGEHLDPATLDAEAAKAAPPPGSNDSGEEPQ